MLGLFNSENMSKMGENMSAVATLLTEIRDELRRLNCNLEQQSRAYSVDINAPATSNPYPNYVPTTVR